MKQVILTGDRPTGKLHLGHYVGSLENRIKLQDIYDEYIMIADMQALTDNFKSPQKVVENIYELALDYLSVDIDPLKATIFIQSQIPELCELTLYYLNLVTINRLQRNPTVKFEIQQKGYDTSVPAGFFCYPVNQAADITAFKAERTPVGEDQLPMIEQTNEIVRRFNHLYHTNCLKEVEPILSQTPKLIGIDGKFKASKSLNNTIFLSDAPEVIKKKVFAMFTDPKHLRATDPGKVAGNVVFTYLDCFHPDKEEVTALKSKYIQGGLGDTIIKSLLNDTLQKMLKPIREKRASFTHYAVKEILFQGTAKAKERVQKNMQEIRHAMGIAWS